MKQATPLLSGINLYDLNKGGGEKKKIRSPDNFLLYVVPSLGK